METLQLKRPDHLGYFFLSALSMFLILFAVLNSGRKISEERIYKSVTKNIENIDRDFGNRIDDFSKRSEYLFGKYEAEKLEHSELLPKEALVIEEDRDISEYYGEIYHFEFKDLSLGEWGLIGISRDIYFLKKLDDNIFYVRFFLDMDEDFLLDELKYRFSFAELEFQKNKANAETEDYGYSQEEDIFFYNHVLKNLNAQIILHLRFSRQDIEVYFSRKGKVFLLLSILCLLIVNLVYFYRKQHVHAAEFSWFAILVDLYLLATLIRDSNLYMKIWNIKFNSTHELLIIAVFLISLLSFFRNRFKYKTINFFVFNLSLLGTVYFCVRIFNALNFVYSDFILEFDYLSLFFLVLILHLLPLLIIRGTCFDKKIKTIAFIAIMQASVVFMGYYILKINPLNTLIFSIILLIMVFFKEGFITRLLIIFLLATSVFSLVANNAINDKKEFITNNLKNIFLNQNNYAKFIAREMVHEINSQNSSLFEFFRECTESDLVDIWRMSIARRENIASGIFLISKDGEVINQYAYQMQYVELPTQEFFPFWAIEETTADLYGKEISLAIASASVKRGTEHLGYIIIQVLNSPKLILRHQDKVNIFTIDEKINGKDLSYIKLNEENQIVENPSNINLEDVAGILQQNDCWIKFSYAGLHFNGYIFRHNRNPIIIFFPGNTFFKNFSEIIKIFLFIFFIFLLFSFKELKTVEWKSIYYSFSIRVFSILILISLLTTVIFSLFSLNFNVQSSERKLRQLEYEKGRTAQNIGSNLISESSEITDHLFLISEILNSDVSIYENGQFLDSSNQRKFINAEIPVYLNSHILNLVNEKNQKFVLSKNGYSLYFKISDYVFDVEFSYNWRRIMSESSYHTDFIITLFFILAVIGFSSAFLFRNKILSPITELNRAMAEVEKGNLEKLKKIPSEIEIENLYLGFNSMVEGIRRDKQNISEISRMKAIIKLGRRVAHEVKNPLTPIKLSAEQILKSLKDKNPGYVEIIKKSVNFIMDETEHLKEVSYGFLDLSRLDEIMTSEFDLPGLVKEEIFNFSQVYPKVDFVVEADPEPCMVLLDKIKMKQVLKNLLVNSIEAIGDKEGKIILNIKEKGDRVSIEVIDNGIGMAEKQLDLIFNIDYSTKEIGTGIGLFIVKRIVDLHKGHIEIHSRKESGTTVVIDLPKNVEEI